MEHDTLDASYLAAFTRQNPLGVLATTAPDGAPEAALVDFVALEDGTLLVTVHLGARKLTNIAADSRVAVVVGTHGAVSLQVEGTARVTEGDERQHLGEAFEAQYPSSRALHEDFALLAITPAWVRSYDVSTRPPTVTETRW